MRIGLARRGHSPSGGAERYLKRFGEALAADGHEAILFTSPEWPKAEWLHGDLIPVEGNSPMKFADALRELDPKSKCDYLFSLERIWECDCYRAGDGVHKYWLEQRAKFEPKWKAATRFLNRKHEEILQLEAKMYDPETTGNLIVNSRMVGQQVRDYYGYPESKIHVVYNGVPRRAFESNESIRKRVRSELGLYETELAILFAGSGWERKGLEFATKAVESLPEKLHARLFVAGKGNKAAYRSRNTTFLGPVADVTPLLEAADIFVLPTTYDPFSNACLEAMAVGLPVITTPTNGFSEILADGEEGTIISDASDIEGIAEGIQHWADKEHRAEAREKSIATAAKYNVAHNLEHTLKVVQQTLT